jgi:hypothetical protein
MLTCSRCGAYSPTVDGHLPVGWSIFRVTRGEFTRRMTVRPKRWLPRTLCPACSNTVLLHLHGKGI